MVELKLYYGEALMDSDEEKCPYCAELIMPAAFKCKHCHADLESESAKLPDPPQKPSIGMLDKIVLGLFTTVALFLTFGAIVGNSSEGQAKFLARAIINLCHREENHYTGNTGAKSCQKLENDFRLRFGHAP